MTPEAAGSYHNLDGSTAPGGRFGIPLLHLSNCFDLRSIPSGHAGYGDAGFAAADAAVVKRDVVPAEEGVRVKASGWVAGIRAVGCKPIRERSKDTLLEKQR